MRALPRDSGTLDSPVVHVLNGRRDVALSFHGYRSNQPDHSIPRLVARSLAGEGVQQIRAGGADRVIAGTAAAQAGLIRAPRGGRRRQPAANGDTACRFG